MRYPPVDAFVDVPISATALCAVGAFVEGGGEDRGEEKEKHEGWWVHFSVGGGREAKESICEDEFYESVAARVRNWICRETGFEVALRWRYEDCFERDVQRISWGQGV
jgi:hypothetical protein